MNITEVDDQTFSLSTRAFGSGPRITTVVSVTGLRLPWPSDCSYCVTVRLHSGWSSDYTNGVFTPEQDTDKTDVEPVHSYYGFHTRSDMSGVKGIVGMHRFNICLVVVLSLSCSGVKTPLVFV